MASTRLITKEDDLTTGELLFLTLSFAFACTFSWYYNAPVVRFVCRTLLYNGWSDPDACLWCLWGDPLTMFWIVHDTFVLISPSISVILIRRWWWKHCYVKTRVKDE